MKRQLTIGSQALLTLALFSTEALAQVPAAGPPIVPAAPGQVMPNPAPPSLADLPPPVEAPTTQFSELAPPEPETIVGPVNIFRPLIDAANAQGGLAWVPRTKTWTPGSSLRVCFLGGTQGLNSFVANVAKAWNGIGANISLNFGPLGDPRRCQPGVNADIRVTYNNQGQNWSRYGVDSVLTRRGWNDASLHLDFRYINSDYGRGTILHEFGHALGMYHEHQKPVENGCENEFNWPVVYSNMYARNGWDRALTDSQIRPISDLGYIVYSDGIDRSSVMLYAFAANELANGTGSRCYTPRNNNAISQGDIAVLQAAYSNTAYEQFGMSIGKAIIAAEASGQPDVARAIALYATPKNELTNISRAYTRELQLGLTPSGPSAMERINAATSRARTNATR